MLEEKNKANLDNNDSNRHYCDNKVFFSKSHNDKEEKGKETT